MQSEQFRFYPDIDHFQTEQNASFSGFHPFYTPKFLQALESSGAVSRLTGWQPKHLSYTTAEGNSYLLPGYLKSHSYGEYVFDWGIADAIRRAGINYYPKWVAQFPFTPVEMPKTIKPFDSATLGYLVDTLWSDSPVTAQLLYLPKQWCDVVLGAGGLIRQSIFFCWHNQDYQTFDDHLNSLTAKRSKDVRRERRKVMATGLNINRFSGSEITDELIDRFYPFYRHTYLSRSGHAGYLNRLFFSSWLLDIRDQTMLVIASNNTEDVAAALFVHDHETLFGRYWGSTINDGLLHFECCYYQGMEYCIERNLKRFNPGVQGEHKVRRGFEPYLVNSAYFYRDPHLRQQLAGYFSDETQQLKHYLTELKGKLPFR